MIIEVLSLGFKVNQNNQKGFYMLQAEAVKVVNFLAKTRAEGDMKGHIINSLNALMMSNDPVSIRFTQILSEAVNRAAGAVLNESAGIPSVPQFQPQPMQYPGQSAAPAATPKAILESIQDHAARLLI
jgi:hypothetical protein